MDWKEFLKHPEVSGSDIQIEPGKYLFGLILHDSLETLNNYQSLAELAAKQTMPDDAQFWFSKWEVTIDHWIKDLMSLQNYYYDEILSLGVQSWKDMIAKVARVPTGLAEIITEAQMITLPNEEEPKNITELALHNLEELSLMCQDIREQAYLRLWKRSYKR